MIYFVLNKIPKNTVPKQVERIRDALSSQTIVLKAQEGPGAIELLERSKL